MQFICYAMAMSFLGLIMLSLSSHPVSAEVIQADRPLDEEKRMERFKKRNDAEGLEELAHRLAGMLDLNSRGISDSFAPLYKQGEYAEALDAYRNYLLTKLCDPAKYGIPESCVGSRNPDPEEAPMDQMLIQTSADELMKDIVTVKNLKINVGEPGAINWLFIPPGWEKDEEPEPGELTYRDNHTSELIWIPPDDETWSMNPSYFARTFRQPVSFNVLLSEYIKTGKREYLDKWADYIDDWCMNQQSDADKSPYNVSVYLPQQLERFILILDNLAYAAQQQEKFKQEVSSAAIVRLLLRRLPETAAATARIQQVFEGNWHYLLVGHLVKIGILFNEFHFSEILIKEGIRAAENSLVTMDLPDGGDYEATPNYLGTLAEWMTYPISKLAMGYPIEHMDDEWIEEMREVTRMRARCILAFLMPNGRWPICAIQDERQQFREYKSPRFMDFIPDFFDVPDNSNRLNRTFPNLSFGDGETNLPPYVSECLPYSGFYFLRGGWEVDDHFGFMKCTGHNVGTGSSLSYWQNDNVISLYAFGKELLFVHNETPLTVDGFDQSVHWGSPIGGHIGYMPPKSILPKLPERRWHDSDNFAFAEGIYDRRYGQPGEHVKAWLLGKEPDPGISDVTHQRKMLLIKPLGLWIITDHLDSTEEHEYEQKWMFHLTEDGNYGPIYGFSAEQIAINEETDTIKTSNPEGANISLYQICSAPLSFETVMAPPNTKKVESWNTEGRDPKYLETGNYLWAYTIHRVNASWKGKGNQVLITAAYPRESIGADLEQINYIENENGLYGFDATLSDGKEISYRVTSDRSGLIKLGDVEMWGESLAIIRSGNGEVFGMSMGAESLNIGGVAQKLETGDAEFTIYKSGKCPITSIYRPIKPVRFMPDTTVFENTIEVTMSSQTPGVEIRYTLDGSAPTVESTLYTQPVILKESARIKARAFRPGITRVPNELSGTEATAITKARFTKQGLRPAAVNKENLAQGLDYDYFESHWREMILQFDKLKSIRSGTVKYLLDTPEATKKGSFAFRYSGYFEAPCDGIYTFYAADPMYDPEIANMDPQYDIEVEVDGELWYPGTHHHGFGSWSIALKKGLHPIEITYADYRSAKEDLYFAFRSYRGAYMDKPELKISGPTIEKGKIPSNLLWH